MTRSDVVHTSDYHNVDLGHHSTIHLRHCASGQRDVAFVSRTRATSFHGSWQEVAEGVWILQFNCRGPAFPGESSRRPMYPATLYAERNNLLSIAVAKSEQKNLVEMNQMKMVAAKPTRRE